MADGLDEVHGEVEGEEHRGEDGEREGRRVAVDDDGRVVGAAGEGPVRVDVADAAGAAAGGGVWLRVLLVWALGVCFGWSKNGG